MRRRVTLSLPAEALDEDAFNLDYAARDALENPAPGVAGLTNLGLYSTTEVDDAVLVDAEFDLTEYVVQCVALGEDLLEVFQVLKPSLSVEDVAELVAWTRANADQLHQVYLTVEDGEISTFEVRPDPDSLI